MKYNIPKAGGLGHMTLENLTCPQDKSKSRPVKQKVTLHSYNKLFGMELKVQRLCFLG